jgi:putative ABC transport system permease protein
VKEGRSVLKNYLKVALRVLVRRKVFTAISLFGISLTLLVLTVATAMLDHVFGQLPPETQMDRTLGVYSLQVRGPERVYYGLPGYAFLQQTVRNLPSVEKVSVFSTFASVASYVEGRKIESYLKRTDGAFWQILDFKFLEGGPFTEQDDQNGAAVAVINETTRRRFFGGEPAAGKTIAADGQSFRVVGVVPDVSILRFAPFADIWVPLSTAKSGTYRQEFRGDFMALLLARSAADVGRVQAEFSEALARVQIPEPQVFDTVHSGADTLFEALARFLFADDTGQSHAGRLRAILAALAILFMLLPAVNLVNLNLSRILERGSEIGVRKAFGASRSTLVGQFLVENLVLTLAGGLIGFGLSGVVLHALNTSGLIPYAHFELNLRVFVWGLGMAAFFGAFSGAYPAWRMARLHPVEALQGKLR